MSTIEEAVQASDLPAPHSGEVLDSYARRVAVHGAYIGAQVALINALPAVVVAQVAQPIDGPFEDDDDD